MEYPALPAALPTLSACGMESAPALSEPRSGRETGITFANTLAADDSVHDPLGLDYLYRGAGVAVGDLDDDGLQDACFAGRGRMPRL